MTMNDIYQSCKEAPTRNDGGQPLFGVTILELRIFHCRYIVDTDADHGTIFCGAEVHRVSYCKAHYKLCYITPSKAVAGSQPGD